MKTIKVLAPASVANMGCGFDVMGMALDQVGDVLAMGISRGKELIIENKSGIGLPVGIEQNVITPAVRSFLDAYGTQVKITVTLLKKILPGSGIGSSAASSSAAVYALNKLLGNPFCLKDLVRFAMEGERLISGTAHADNVGPALMGGIVFIRGYDPLDMIELPVPEKFCCTVVHPHITVSTKAAREALKKEVPLRNAVTQWGNVGGLVAGLAMNDLELAARSMKDVVAEPYRKHFIPEYDRLKEKVIKAGALAMNISGSGPSVFALSSSESRASDIGNLMKSHFTSLDYESDVYISNVSRKGVREID